MKVEDTISTLQRLKEENGDGWKTVVANGKEEERNEEYLPICDYFSSTRQSKESDSCWMRQSRTISFFKFSTSCVSIQYTNDI